jgi:hypothetical protein
MEITLAGYTVQIDAIDLERINAKKWQANKTGKQVLLIL